MRKKRRTEVTIETHAVTIIRGDGGALPAWCDACGRATRMVTPEWAAAASRVGARQIYRWVEEGSLHFVETPERLFVCADSLAARAGGPPRADANLRREKS